MSHGSRRALVVLLALASLSLPLAAQPHRESARTSPPCLAELWNRWNQWTASLSALWSQDSDAGPATTEDTPAPRPESTPPPVPDGRSVIDPLG